MEPADTTKRNPTQSDVSKVLDILAATESLNKHFLTQNAGKFLLDTSVQPWVINVLDVDGNVVMKLPPQRVIDLADGVSKLPNPGVAIDIEG